MMGDVLKPCPFCGGEARLYSGEGRNYDWHGVKCDGSGADVCPVFPDTTPLPSKTLAITAWNTRADAGCIAELVALVIQYRDDLRRPPNADSVERRLEAITAALINITTAERKDCDNV